MKDYYFLGTHVGGIEKRSWGGWGWVSAKPGYFMKNYLGRSGNSPYKFIAICCVYLGYFTS